MSTSVDNAVAESDITSTDPTRTRFASGEAEGQTFRAARRDLATTLQRNVDLLAVLYVTLPLALFLALTFRPLIGIAAAILVAVAGYPLLRSTRAQQDRVVFGWRTIVVLALAATAWSFFAGGDQIMLQNGDWTKHFGIIEDLQRNAWPVTYGQDPNGASVILRYYAGFHIVPALAAKAMGHMALMAFAWKAIGVFLVLMILLRRLSTTGGRAVAGIAFFVFGGLDLLGYLWIHGTLTGLSANTVALDHWTVAQYNSSSVLLGAVPNHALAAWLGVLLCRDHKNSPAFVLGIPLLMIAISFWSVFAAIGLMPFVLAPVARAMVRARHRFVFHPAVVAASMIAGITGLFLSTDASGGNVHGFIWSVHPNTNVTFLAWLLIAFTVLPIVVALATTKVRFDHWTIVAIVLLCVFPFYVFGTTSDFTMRASIPAWMVLFLQVCRVIEARYSVTSRLSHGSRRHARRRRPSTLGLLPLGAVLAVGSVTSLCVFDRTVDPLPHSPGDPTIPSRILAVATSQYVPDAQYLARESPLLTKVLNHRTPAFAYTPVELDYTKWVLDPPSNSSNSFITATDDSVRLTGRDEGTARMMLPTGENEGIFRIRATIELSSPELVDEVLMVANTFPIEAVVEKNQTTLHINNYIELKRGARVSLDVADMIPGANATVTNFSLERISRITT